MSARLHGDRDGHDLFDTARRMRGAAAVIRGRMQLMRRRQERGGPTGQPTAADFVVVDAAVGRLVALIERLEG